jgi:hypothetical protein
MSAGIVARQEWAAGQASALRAEALTAVLDEMLARTPAADAADEARTEPPREAASR